MCGLFGDDEETVVPGGDASLDGEQVPERWLVLTAGRRRAGAFGPFVVVPEQIQRYFLFLDGLV